MGTKFMGVEFAPLRIPLERRVQTFAAAVWILSAAFGSPVSWLAVLLVLLLGNLWLRTLMIGYLLFVYWDRETRLTGGRRFVVNICYGFVYLESICKYSKSDLFVRWSICYVLSFFLYLEVWIINESENFN